MRKNVEDFLALPISEAAKEKILWTNGVGRDRDSTPR